MAGDDLLDGIAQLGHITGHPDLVGLAVEREPDLVLRWEARQHEEAVLLYVTRAETGEHPFLDRRSELDVRRRDLAVCGEGPAKGGQGQEESEEQRFLAHAFAV